MPNSKNHCMGLKQGGNLVPQMSAWIALSVAGQMPVRQVFA